MPVPPHPQSAIYIVREYPQLRMVPRMIESSVSISSWLRFLMHPVHTRPQQNHVSERVKQLFQPVDALNAGAEWIPFFCVEARIDFNDVRTGFRETVSLCKALEIYSDNADLLWTDDMIRDVDLRCLAPSIPAGIHLGILPDFVNSNFLAQMENQFVQYLLRSYEAKIFRNFDLNVYSESGESRAEFCRRCLELFDGRKRYELDRLLDVFNRKLEQVKQKYLGVTESGGLEQTRSESRNRAVFSRYSEQMAEFFNSAEIKLKPVTGPPPQNPDIPELEERLATLDWEVHQEISKLKDSFLEKANAIDEYLLHPNLKDIHFVRSCILWMPREKA
jgi:hypothetical protein